MRPTTRRTVTHLLEAEDKLVAALLGEVLLGEHALALMVLVLRLVLVLVGYAVKQAILQT